MTVNNKNLKPKNRITIGIIGVALLGVFMVQGAGAAMADENTPTPATTSVASTTPATDAPVPTDPTVDPNKFITDFTINASIDTNKKLSVTENFTYNFGENKTDEIYREFRLSDFADAPQITAKVDGDPITNPTLIGQSSAWEILVLDNNKQGWTGNHNIEITYTASVTVNEILRNAVYDNPQIKKDTVQFIDWEALIPLWKAPIKNLTINLTLPTKASYLEYANSTTNTHIQPTTTDENKTSTYTLTDISTNSNGLTASIQFDTYVFTDNTSVGTLPSTDQPTAPPVEVAKTEDKAPSFVLVGLLALLAIVGVVFKITRNKKQK